MSPRLKIGLLMLALSIIGVCIVGWWMKQSNHLSIRDERIRTSNGNYGVPKRRSSLSTLSWKYYDDAYYSYSIDEREMHRSQGFDNNDTNRWLWIPALAGIDLFYEQPTEKQEQEFRRKVEMEFTKVNAAFKSEDAFLGNELLRGVSHTGNSVYHFFNGVLSEYRNDIKAAHRWYQLAAKDWCKEALFNLGVFYEFGIGVKTDAELAEGYYQRAAIQGDKEALQRWQKLSGSNATLPDIKLVPIFNRRPWPDKSVLAKGTEFAALRDDVGRWWDVPFSKVKDFFETNDNQVDGKFFFNTSDIFIDDENSTAEQVEKHFEINRDQICNFEERDAWPAVEVWDGKKMHFVKANDIQAVRNIVLYYILVTGKDAFTDLNSGGKYDQLVTSEMKKEIANRNDGNGIIPIYKLMTDELLLIPDKR